MRDVFPGYFRPTLAEFQEIWSTCIFALDANVLLNLYRYSKATRESLVKAIESVRDRVFLPNHAAKEFLRSRLGVTAGQAEEYTRAIKQIKDLVEILSNSKKHPFLPDAELPLFREQADRLCKQLEAQKLQVVEGLTRDAILDRLENLFAGQVGPAFDDAKMKAIQTEGLLRYQNEIPPGYKDGKKDGSGDSYRKFGDLIVWKQVLQMGKDKAGPVVLITDDLKEDWWLEQSGRTIGPRPELIEEFLAETGQKFWMYSVDKFLEEVAKAAKVEVSQAVIEEVIESREQTREQADVEALSDQLSHIADGKTPSRKIPAFMKPLQPSPELAAIVGDQPLPRTEVVSKLWAYIKKHHLQDATNKRLVHADEKLLAIFETPTVSMLEMAGLIGKHVK